MFDSLQGTLIHQNISLNSSNTIEYSTKNKHDSTWNKKSWMLKKQNQMPTWPDINHANRVLDDLNALPPLTTIDEINSLRNDLAEVGRGEKFLLQGGACAESFDDVVENKITAKAKLLTQMANIITFMVGKQVTIVGRIGGQFAKPRSSEYEEIKGVKYLSYKGDMINSSVLNHASRIPNPERMRKGYDLSKITVKKIRNLCKNNISSLANIYKWNEEILHDFHQSHSVVNIAQYQNMIIDSFLEKESDNTTLIQRNIFTSHEALLLPYEESLTRMNNGLSYAHSAHMLWIGERTRELDGAHVEFVRGIENPIGIKIGPNYQIKDILSLCKKVNPSNSMGRISLITRFGQKKIMNLLPPLIQAIQENGVHVVWVCDPMHGNTYVAKNGIKTRNFDDILNEIESFITLHTTQKTIAGGLHLELTADNVTECIGGSTKIKEEDLADKYLSLCDPRLNCFQSLELALWFAEKST